MASQEIKLLVISVVAFFILQDSNAAITPLDETYTRETNSDVSIIWTFDNVADVNRIDWSYDSPSSPTPTIVMSRDNLGVVQVFNDFNIEHVTDGSITLKEVTEMDNAGIYYCTVAYKLASGFAPVTGTVTLSLTTAPDSSSTSTSTTAPTTTIPVTTITTYSTSFQTKSTSSQISTSTALTHSASSSSSTSTKPTTTTSPSNSSSSTSTKPTTTTSPSNSSSSTSTKPTTTTSPSNETTMIIVSSVVGGLIFVGIVIAIVLILLSQRKKHTRNHRHHDRDRRQKRRFNQGNLTLQKHGQYNNISYMEYPGMKYYLGHPSTDHQSYTRNHQIFYGGYNRNMRQDTDMHSYDQRYYGGYNSNRYYGGFNSNLSPDSYMHSLEQRCYKGLNSNIRPDTDMQSYEQKYYRGQHYQ